jgi:long-chain-fatty-acid--[acyl-carrier-protein] ligase
MPRRKVTIEIALAPKEITQKKERLEINRSLEEWYNQYPYEGKVVETEPLVQVSYSFWKKDFLEPFEKIHAKKHVSRKFSSKTEEKVYEELSRKFPDREIEEGMDLALDLGMDSLDKAEIVSFLSVQFDIKNIHPEEIQTVRDILEVAEGKKKSEVAAEDFAFSWPKELGEELPAEILEGKTIPEVFLKQCERLKGNPACSDDLVGVLSYRKFKLAALLLAKEIRKLPGKNIGILLPATVGTYLTIMATWLAKKTPVMLNWTLGPRYLNHMMELTQLETVISSWRFLERVSNVDFGELVNKVKFLEDLKESISTAKKLSGLVSSLKKPRNLLKGLDLSNQGDDIAVILFTSGTEAAPKAVPLSHKNILFDLRESLRRVKMYSSDVLYGMLPPFHSFGFTVTGIFPLIAGIKATYSPDPTDSLYLAKGIDHWKCTIFCSAPSFLRAIIQVAKPEELQSIRMFVIGAEKLPQELIEKLKKLRKDILIYEGYGITECSPILTLKKYDKGDLGVGPLLDGIEFCTVHPETKELLDEGKEGEMCVRGENVFSGYLGTQKSPFIEIKGKKWYCTGDLGYLDNAGNVILSGRLKRFAKIGGEMVSLGGIEEVLLQKLPKEAQEGPALAILALEKGNEKAHLVLFSTISVKVEEVNSILKDFGFSRLIKISEVINVERIPVLGTGKIDYRSLQKTLTEGS